jgi:hypothetical protein
MLGLCSVLENPGPSRPAPREGSGADMGGSQLLLRKIDY